MYTKARHVSTLISTQQQVLKRKTRMIREFVLWIINDAHKAIEEARADANELDDDKVGAWVKRNGLEFLSIADKAVDLTIQSVNLARSIRRDTLEHFTHASSKKKPRSKKPRSKSNKHDFPSYDFEPIKTWSEDNED